MYFETADIFINPLIPPIVAFVISSICSIGGISGAFILLPFQMSVLGFNTPSVSATNHLFNIVGIPGGVYRYFKEGRMLFPLAVTILVGTIPGVLLGTIIRLEFLPDPFSFQIFAGFLILYIAIQLIRNILERKNEKTILSKNNEIGKTEIIKFNFRFFKYRFNDIEYKVSTLLLALLATFVGLAGGVYGIGGGAIIAPILVSFFKLPIYTIAGACLLGTLATSFFAVIFFQILSPYYPQLSVSPDWLLGFLFGLGGLAGTYFGARLQKYIPPIYIKIFLVAVLLFVAFNYLSKLFF